MLLAASFENKAITYMQVENVMKKQNDNANLQNVK